jgi:hypothetical protein
MYRTCLFCSADLGTNEAIEAFPVGARVAFDAWKGRLWAVCPGCARWNLAPIEERWEAVETADRLFTDSRTRVHSQNIGLCRLRDGTRLVRVGAALPGEFAAWRYGSQLVSRRRQHLLGGAAGLAGLGTFIAGMPFLISAGAPLAAFSLGMNAFSLWQHERQQRRIVHRLDAGESPTGDALVIRRRHLHGAVMDAAEDGVAVSLHAAALEPGRGWRGSATGTGPRVVLTGTAARRVLARSMVDYNHHGAKPDDIGRVLARIERHGGPEAFVRHVAQTGASLTRSRPFGRTQRQTYSVRQILGTFRGEILPVTRYRSPFSDDRRAQLGTHDALALEIALNEDAERRALEGELAALEAAWREAEEIAHIADALPGEPPAGSALPPRPPLRVSSTRTGG